MVTATSKRFERNFFPQHVRVWFSSDMSLKTIMGKITEVLVFSFNCELVESFALLANSSKHRGVPNSKPRFRILRSRRTRLGVWWDPCGRFRERLKCRSRLQSRMEDRVFQHTYDFNLSFHPRSTHLPLMLFLFVRRVDCLALAGNAICMLHDCRSLNGNEQA